MPRTWSMLKTSPRSQTWAFLPTLTWLLIVNGYTFFFHFLGPKGIIPCLKGAFDSFEHEHLPRTKYDAIVDETSNKPGEQAFEVSNSSLLHN